MAAAADGGKASGSGGGRKAAAECCPICCEAFSAQRRKRVACSFCAHEACVECVKRFLLSTHDDPHCMACRRAWPAEFVDATLTKAFRTSELRAHREAVLFERERRRLADTQQVIAEQEERRRLGDRLKELRAARRDLDRQIADVEALIRASKAGVQLRHAPARKAVRVCPCDGCRGFVNEDWACGLCGADVCRECHERRDPAGHVCDPDVVSSVRLLARDSRTCPSCPAIIHKIEGCDQMFCTRCHTAFSFETGQVERGVIHNPHFYEWQRQQNGGVAPRVPGDDPCRALNQLPWRTQVTAKLAERADAVTLDQHNKVKYIHRALDGVVRVGRAEYAGVTPMQDEQAREALRIKFLRGELEEDKFKRLLHRQEQAVERKRALGEIMDMFCEVSKEAFNRFVEDGDAARVCEDVVAVGHMAVDQSRAVDKRFGTNSERFRKWINTVAEW